MLGGRGSSITDSGAGNMNRVTLGKLGLPARPKVVEHFWPRRQAATADDACEHRPKVLSGTAVAIDDIQGSLRCQLEGFFQVGAQFRVPVARPSEPRWRESRRVPSTLTASAKPLSTVCLKTAQRPRPYAPFPGQPQELGICTQGR